MTTKIAILTDIHGNSAALKAVLNDIDRNSCVERIYSLGDMIAIGPDTNEVLTQLFSRNDVTMLLGNHEEAILNIIKEKRASSDPEFRIHHDWIAEQISREFVTPLSNLPKVLSSEYEGKSLLLLHYHMDEKLNLLPVDEYVSSEKLDNMYSKSPSDIVCFGHHHESYFAKSNQRSYFNPGSLGCFIKPIARYGILHIDRAQITVETRQVSYDNSRFLASYQSLNVPRASSILKIYHGNQFNFED